MFPAERDDDGGFGAHLHRRPVRRLRRPRPGSGHLSLLLAVAWWAQARGWPALPDRGGRLLLRFTSLFKSKTSPQDLQCADDYFLYTYTPVVPGGKPSLARLPAWLREEDKELYLRTQQERKKVENMWKSCRPSSHSAEETPEVRWVDALLREEHEEQMALGVDVDEDIEPSSLIPENLGLVCSEDGDRFVVAELHQLYKTTNDEGVSAELSLFRSDGGGPSSLEIKHLPLDYHPLAAPCVGSTTAEA